MSNPPTQYVEEILKNSQAQDKNYHSIIEYFVGKSMNLVNNCVDKMRVEGIQKMATLRGRGSKIFKIMST